MAVRLPVPGGDDGDWGDILNTFLEVAHNNDGSLQASALQQAGVITAPGSLTISGTPTSGQVLTATSGTTADWAIPSSGGGPSTLAGDSDVSISGPGTNQVLAYNGSHWQNATLTESDVTGLTSDLSTLTSSVSARYTKPGTGIPASDLSTGVQSSLTAAGSAVQVGGDIGGTAVSPTVSKIQGTAISAPSGGSTAYLDATGHWSTPAGGGGGGGATLDTTATDIKADTITGTAVAGNTGLAADAGHQHPLVAHDHTTANKGGQIPVGGLSATGTASSSTYLRGDGSWSTPAAGIMLDSTAGDIQPLGVQAAGTTGRAADAGHVHAMPRLDQVSAPTGGVALNSQKITGLANGTASTDAAAFGQIPVAGTSGSTYTAGNDSRVTGAVQASTATAKGDLLAASAASTVTRLGVGANGQVLTADSTQTTGLKWATATGGSGGVAGWKNLVSDYGADSTGATSVSSALASACSAAVAAQPASFGLMVPVGTYLVTAAQDLPWNMVLQGAGSAGGDVTSQFTGTWFKVAASFSGTYVFGFRDNADHSSANGAIVSGIGILGSSHTSSAVDGMYISGPSMTNFQNINISQMSGWATNCGTDSSAGELGPYGATWQNVQANSCGKMSGGGFNLIWFEDSRFTECYSIGNGHGPGFYISDCDNTKFTGCNAEWNSTHGFYVTGDWQWATGGCTFANCSTDANGQYGLYIDATWTTGGGPGTGPCMILVSNLFFRRDGQNNAAASAGIAIGATTLPIVINGFGTMPNIGDGGTGTMAPAYGIYFSAASYSGTMPKGQPIGIFNGLAWGQSSWLGVNGAASNTIPTGVTTASIMRAHGDNDTPTYGS